MSAWRCVLMAAIFAPACHAQSMAFEGGDGKTRVVVHEAEGEMTAEAKERQRWLAGVEKSLRRLNAEYFRVRSVQIRQVGISELRDYNDPAVWPTMLEVFDRSGDDVWEAMLDMFADHESDEGDATLAWIATFEDNEFARDEATKRLNGRLVTSGEARPSDRVSSVVALGLQSDDNDVLTNAANLANRLNLVEAIPALINAQLSGQSVRTGRTDGGGGALAYILVGTQVSFVSDLTPVVGDSAVGFDPTVSVVTDGVVLSIGDAVVITYRTEVHNALVGLSSRAWGQSTAELGYDQRDWHDWYKDEFVPYMDEQRRAEIEARLKDQDAG